MSHHLQGRRGQALAANDASPSPSPPQGGGSTATDAAQPLHFQDRHLPEGPPLNEPLEAPKLHDVQPDLDHLVRLVSRT